MALLRDRPVRIPSPGSQVGQLAGKQATERPERTLGTYLRRTTGVEQR
jgi:hypothetical protein